METYLQITSTELNPRTCTYILYYYILFCIEHKKGDCDAECWGCLRISEHIVINFLAALTRLKSHTHDTWETDSNVKSNHILGTFANREERQLASTSPSVLSSVRMEQLYYYLMDFQEI